MSAVGGETMDFIKKVRRQLRPYSNRVSTVAVVVMVVVMVVVCRSFVCLFVYLLVRERVCCLLVRERVCVLVGSVCMRGWLVGLFVCLLVCVRMRACVCVCV